MDPWFDETNHEGEEGSSYSESTFTSCHGDSSYLETEDEDSCFETEDEDSCCSSARSIVSVASPTLIQPQTDAACSSFIKAQQVPVPVASHWTDDMHSSYLSFMEATFVKGLYDREYCAVDLCGQAPHRTAAGDSHSAVSHPQFPSPFLAVSSETIIRGLVVFLLWNWCSWILAVRTFEGQMVYMYLQFKSYQYGDLYPTRISKRAHPCGFHYDLFANPWVKHFRYNGSKELLQEIDKKAVSPKNDAFHKDLVASRNVQPNGQDDGPESCELSAICRAGCGQYDTDKRFSQTDLDQGRKKIIKTNKTNQSIGFSDQGG